MCNRRENITPDDLEPTWVAEPRGSPTIDFGDGWISSLTATLLMMLSVIVPEKFNVLINPVHPDARKIRAAVVRQYVYDPRF